MVDMVSWDTDVLLLTETITGLNLSVSPEGDAVPERLTFPVKLFRLIIAIDTCPVERCPMIN